MQQKVQLIGTVIHKPDLLILDEPFSGLDPINQELFRELLLDYRPRARASCSRPMAWSSPSGCATTSA